MRSPYITAAALALAACSSAAVAPAPQESTWRLISERGGNADIADSGLSLSDCMGVAAILADVNPRDRDSVIYCEREASAAGYRHQWEG